MSIQQALFAAMLLGASVTSALASAPMHVANTQNGFIEHGPEYRKVNGQWQRVDTWNGLDSPAPDRRSYRQGETSADGNFTYVGGDQGWAPRAHAYKWENGGLLHVDTLRHDTPKANLNMTAEDRRRQIELYGGN